MSTVNFNKSPLLTESAAGALNCPSGTRYGASDLLGALEAASEHVMKLGNRSFTNPRFEISTVRTVAARSDQPTNNRVNTRYRTFWPNLHAVRFDDPTPKSTLGLKVNKDYREMGPVEIAASQHDTTSIGCSPSLGAGALMGKDVMTPWADTGTLSLGPFCVTEFQAFEDLVAILRSAADQAPSAAVTALHYNRIRDVVSHCRKNAAPIVNQLSPHFQRYSFSNLPDTQGTLEWWIEWAGSVSIDFPRMEALEICMSAGLLKHLVREYLAAHNVQFEAMFGTEMVSVGNYSLQFASGQSVKVMNDRTNQEILFKSTPGIEPTYVYAKETASGQIEWDFQPYFRIREGEDTRTGQASGWVQTKSDDYGRARVYDPATGVMTRVYELVALRSKEESFDFETFATNPFKLNGMFDSANLESNLDALWNSPELDWMFGHDVDRYMLEPMRAADPSFTGNNMNKTWFGARLTIGGVVNVDNYENWSYVLVPVVDARRGGSAAVVKSDVVTSESQQIIPSRPDAFEPCEPNGDAPANPSGSVVTSCGSLDVQLQPEGNDISYPVFFARTGGFAGDLADVTVTIKDHTAEAGEDFEVPADLVLEWPAGKQHQSLNITFHGRNRSDDANGGDRYLVLKFAGDDLAEGACTEVRLNLKPANVSGEAINDTETPDTFTVNFEADAFDETGDSIQLRDSGGNVLATLTEGGGNDYTAGDYAGIATALAGALDQAAVVEVDANMVIFGDTAPTVGAVAVADLKIVTLDETAAVIS